MELPDDAVRRVISHFSGGEAQEALSELRCAMIHTGDHANPRLLRCAAVSSGGDLSRLHQQIQQVKVDWREVIMAGEYRFEAGKNVRVHDFNQEIEDT